MSASKGFVCANCAAFNAAGGKLCPCFAEKRPAVSSEDCVCDGCWLLAKERDELKAALAVRTKERDDAMRQVGCFDVLDGLREKLKREEASGEQ